MTSRSSKCVKIHNISCCSMLPLPKCSDIFETRLQPQIVSGERLSMLQDNGFFSQSAVFPPCHERCLSFRALGIMGKCTDRHLFSFGGLVLHQIRWTIALNRSRHFFIQLEVKPKPIVTHSHSFFCTAWNSLEFWSVHWIFCVLVIGQSDYLGFGFATLNWKPLSSLSWN